jgi:hypothetical protein
VLEKEGIVRKARVRVAMTSVGNKEKRIKASVCVAMASVSKNEKCEKQSKR